MKRIALALAAVTAWAACGGEEPPPAGMAPPVMVVRVDAHDVIDRIQATGQLLAVDEASVAAEVAGRLTDVLVREGAAVEAEQIVLEIDRGRRELTLANERARVAEAEQAIGRDRREYKRVASLYEKKAASKSQLDVARTALKSAESRHAAATAQLGLAERALRDASVAAPFAGLVARRYVSAGDYVQIGQKLFDLVALDPIEVEFHLTERDSSRVEIGDAVGVRVAPFPEEVFAARVHVISPRIDPATRTLRVKAQLDNAARRLRPGLFARVDLGVAERSGVPMIPEEAILQRSDGSVVYVLRGDDRVERRNLRTGVYRRNLVEVISGLEVGEYAVVRGHQRLVDGSPVDVRNEDGTPAAPPAIAGGPDPTGTTP